MREHPVWSQQFLKEYGELFKQFVVNNELSYFDDKWSPAMKELWRYKYNELLSKHDLPNI